MSFLLSFVLWSFQVLGEDLIDYGIKSGKSLSLGMNKATQVKFKDTKNPKLGDAPEGIPSFISNTIGISYLELYFYSSHYMCFA